MEPGPRIIAPKKMLGQISGHLWEQIILPTQLPNDRVLWSPANAGPWAIRNQAVTIHDASVFDHPEWFRPSFIAWTRLSLKILAKQVKAVIAVSSFSHERLKYHLKIPDNKIHVIPNGVGKPFELQPQKTIEVVKEKYGLTRPYFLFVGTVEPRKNLPNLFQAWEQAEINNYALIIAGKKGTVFAEAINQPGKSDNIKWLGYVPDAELPAFYAGATAAIIPSLYEGFGLTALEAMACGAPVIASNTTAFPETTGDAALLVDPYNPNELTDAMKSMIENKKLANTLRERGLHQVAQFTWEESACRTQSLLEGL
jgi:glycosyltransferase involved in cell wall biosynthesis